MALEGLGTVLEALREQSRWSLVVHPDDADEARLAVIKAHLVPQVRVVEHRYMRQGDACLINPLATWQLLTPQPMGFGSPDEVTERAERLRRFLDSPEPKVGKLITKTA
jgi:hypothetical protein